MPPRGTASGHKTKAVFSTEWFRVVEKTYSKKVYRKPYYALELPDYVSVLAKDEKGRFILVRQYRPSVDRPMLELPSGHVDRGETPARAARRELLEETGYRAKRMVPLGCLVPDTGRMSNRLWCYWADRAERGPLRSAACHPDPDEASIETVLLSRAGLMRMIRTGGFSHALNLAAIAMAASRNFIHLSRPLKVNVGVIS